MTINKENGIMRLLSLKKSDIHRQGIVFWTKENPYLYDTGTGKVIQLDESDAQVIFSLFDDRLTDKDFANLFVNEKQANDIADFFKEEHLLCNPSVRSFLERESLMNESNMVCGQIIIELTGECNMRCKYCTYNEHYEETRGFTGKNIEFETAQKAIDYAYSHRNPDHFAVTFYGGEPLINFDVMKKCIDYCLETYGETEFTFSLTTNLTLVTSEIADYLAQIPGLALLVSLDGPENIQNENRIYANGKPSFDQAFKGLQLLSNAISKYETPRSILAISSVIMPPYTTERFNIINNFFESIEFLPNNTTITATYPSPGSIPDSVIVDLKAGGYDETQDVAWMDWALDVAIQRNDLPTTPNIFSKYLSELLVPIHKRRLTVEPFDKFPCNGNCLPTHRRIYVCTDGTYMICEKIGEAPSIGHVSTGIDWDAVKEYYIKQYDKASLSDCSLCWAINLCNVCYAECFSKDGINMERKRRMCKGAREAALNKLILYYDLLESHPKLIELVSTYERH